MKRFSTITLILISFLVSIPLTAQIAVIAPTFSDHEIAEDILMHAGLVEVDPYHATLILVVIHSDLYNPLFYSYDSFRDLKDAAELWSSPFADRIHIYIYEFDYDLSVYEMDHKTISIE